MEKPPLNEVAFTAGFLDDARTEGMTESEIETMVQLLAANPEAGDLIQGSGVVARSASQDTAKASREVIGS